jgi:hypothetical protein
MLYQNPAIRSRVEVHLVEEAKGGPSKLLLSFLFFSIPSLYRDNDSSLILTTAVRSDCPWKNGTVWSTHQ